MTCGLCSTGTEVYTVDSCGNPQICYPDDLADAELGVSSEVCYPIDAPRWDGGSSSVALPVVLSCPNPDEMENWPRFTVAQRRSGSISLYIFRPDQRNPSQILRELTLEDIRTYWERFRGTRQIDAANSTTWGEVTSLNLPLCYLNRLADGRRELYFDPDRSDTRWTLNVYNLSPVWRTFIIRTLMIFPIEFMRMMPIRSLYLDFRVGMVPGATGVGTGGANWPRCHHSNIPQEHRNGICVAFAALNRPWCNHRQNIVSLNPSCQQIEDSFADANNVASTIYHEYGHIFQWCPRERTDFPDGESGEEEFRQEVDYWEELTRNGRIQKHNDSHTGEDSGLWDRFRMAINYSGTTQEPGEGFAEAFRMRMMGLSLGTGGIREARQRAEEVLDLAGIPTRSSVASARQAINQYLSTHQL